MTAMKSASLVIGMALAGCSTVIPANISTVQASYDGNEQTSGILKETPLGYVVTAHFRDRYNVLVAVYGGDFTVPIKPDAGLTAVAGSDQWMIDREHLAQFIEMQAWHRAGLAPQHPPASGTF